MDEKEVHQAKLKIIIAADWWAREILRSDKILNSIEQKLFDAIIHYQKLEKSFIEIPVKIPRPPNLPIDLFQEFPTKRYSEIPTVQSNLSKESVTNSKSIDKGSDHFNNSKEDIWIGK